MSKVRRMSGLLRTGLTKDEALCSWFNTLTTSDMQGDLELAPLTQAGNVDLKRFISSGAGVVDDRRRNARPWRAPQRRQSPGQNDWRGRRPQPSTHDLPQPQCIGVRAGGSRRGDEVAAWPASYGNAGDVVAGSNGAKQFSVCVQQDEAARAIGKRPAGLRVGAE